ncbi:hypothetical protein FGO68_gene9657 [Halteria grandinella]|uniref:Transmembrane protein n=1 Tax=Halteria grandinella TaxID=5974 RepID=A0A8J8NQX9_HALGN|nr:hypothetical protein FGO68_gene9657 [Halteria grandinella]
MSPPCVDCVVDCGVEEPPLKYFLGSAFWRISVAAAWAMAPYKLFILLINYYNSGIDNLKRGLFEFNIMLREKENHLIELQKYSCSQY